MTDRADDPFAPFEPGETASTAGPAPAAEADFEPLPPPEGVEPPAAHPTLGPWARIWPYHNADRSLAGYICRFEPDGGGKEFRPLRYGRIRGRVDWHWRGWAGDNARPLYHLPDLLDRPDAPVLAVEGEKAADAAAERFPEVAVVSPMNGARSPQRTDWSPVDGRPIAIWPDADDPGRKFARDVAQLALAAGAVEARIVEVPEGARDGWDLADELPAGWSDATVATALAEAAPFAPDDAAAPPDDDAEIGRLAALSLVDYDRQRDQAAKRLRVRVGTLDEEVKRKRAEIHGVEPVDGMGRALDLPETEPWPHPGHPANAGSSSSVKPSSPGIFQMAGFRGPLLRHSASSGQALVGADRPLPTHRAAS